ncbi:pyrimidine dimer DNA glycosylase/endonuclease V [Nocardia noduli]|uniref:pyrimidine dimer DNA glycosylase/endonuclease V n=1 Tax=Nocardia noduli TaxID=2815722 RepID=UPI001C250D62|nr:pyrimidine dimer DNA glycosylase/endonuclease V [Nocardia noduli]
MSWAQSQPESPTDPGHYHDAADEREARLRADFALYHYLSEIAPFGETPEQIAEFTEQARLLSQRWADPGDVEAHDLWTQLDAATRAWQAHPETTRAAYDRVAAAHADGDEVVDDLTLRSMAQAAVLTGRIEPDITGSVQDMARSRPQDRANVIELRPNSAVDRTLGGRGPEVSLAEIDAIIATTDELLDAEELHGDLDTGADQRAVERAAALRKVQDLSAEHTRTSERFAGVTSHDLDLIERLEDLLAQTREARSDAALAGADQEQIDRAYLAGRDGTYAHATTEPDPAAAHIDAAVAAALPTDGIDPPDTDTDPGLDLDLDLEPGPSRDIGAAL